MTLTALQWETVFCNLMCLQGYSSAFTEEKAASLSGLFDALNGTDPALVFAGEQPGGALCLLSDSLPGVRKTSLYAAALGILEAAIGPADDVWIQRLFSEGQRPALPPLPDAQGAAAALAAYKKTPAYVLREARRRSLFDPCVPPDETALAAQLKFVCEAFGLSVRDVSGTAKRLMQLPFVEAVCSGSTAIIPKLASFFCGTKNRNSMQFAIRFCSCLAPEHYPVCDRYAAAALRYCRDTYGFYPFLNADLADYDKFRKILLLFRRKYSLTDFSPADAALYLSAIGQQILAIEEEENK